MDTTYLRDDECRVIRKLEETGYWDVRTDFEMLLERLIEERKKNAELETRERVYRHAINSAELTLHDMELSDFPAPDAERQGSIHMTLGTLRDALSENAK